MIRNYTVDWAVYGTFFKSFWTSALTLFAYSTWRCSTHAPVEFPLQSHRYKCTSLVLELQPPNFASWTSSLHRSRSMIKVCKPLRTWLSMEGPSSLNRALEHSLQHLLLCMHRSSALAKVARILGFRLGFVGRL